MKTIINGMRALLLTSISDFSNGWFCAETAIRFPVFNSKYLTSPRSNDDAFLIRTMAKGYAPLTSSWSQRMRCFDSAIVGSQRDFIFDRCSRKLVWGYTLCFTYREASRTALWILSYLICPQYARVSAKSTPTNPILYLGSHNCTYFYHFFYDFVPRLIDCLKYFKETGVKPVLLLPDQAQKSFICAVLEILKSRYSFAIYWTHGDVLISGPCYTLGIGRYTGNVTRETHDKLLRSFACIFRGEMTTARGERYRLLLLRDKDSRGGFDVCTTELMIRRAETEGFRIVTLSEYGIEKQFNILANAEVVIAVHGADLTLVPYIMKAPGRVIEIMDRNWCNSCYARALMHTDLDHYIYFISDGRTGRRENVHLSEEDVNQVFDIALRSSPAQDA